MSKTTVRKRQRQQAQHERQLEKWRDVKGEKTRHHPLLDRWGKRTQARKICRLVFKALIYYDESGG